MSELLFWLMLVDLVLGSGSGRKSRARTTVSHLTVQHMDILADHVAILTSFNRNFKARNDGNLKTSESNQHFDNMIYAYI
jgi:hypothetical protein